MFCRRGVTLHLNFTVKVGIVTKYNGVCRRQMERCHEVHNITSLHLGALYRPFPHNHRCDLVVAHFVASLTASWEGCDEDTTLLRGL